MVPRRKTVKEGGSLTMQKQEFDIYIKDRIISHRLTSFCQEKEMKGISKSKRKCYEQNECFFVYGENCLFLLSTHVRS